MEILHGGYSMNYWQWGFTTRQRIQPLLKKHLILHRAQRIDDLERLASLSGYEREYRFNHVLEWKEAIMLHESTQILIAHSLSSSERMLYPLGYAVLKHNTLSNEIISMAVHPEYRRLGIGAKMVWDIARRIDFGSLVVQCLEEDLENLQFFRTFNFDRSVSTWMATVTPGKYTMQRKPSIQLEMLHPRKTWERHFEAKALRA
jgi:GNAT superfamily N-acetyltransferase